MKAIRRAVGCRLVETRADGRACVIAGEGPLPRPSHPGHFAGMLLSRLTHGARVVSAEIRAQATVEMAVVLPVMLVLALIVYNLMLFAVAVARFDRVAPDIVIAHAVAPPGDLGVGATPSSIVAVVSQELERAMEGHAVEITVERSSDELQTDAALSLVGALETYRCRMRFMPWPTSFSLAGVEFGAPVALEHVRSVTIDPWRSGVVV